MDTYHINAATMCPLGSNLIPGGFPREIVCHALLVEAGDRLVLVDTGLGTRDLENLRRIGTLRWLMQPSTDPSQTAAHAVRERGFSADDVTDIVATHLDLDHAGGIDDFPEARVHVHADELRAARARNGILGRLRYRPGHLATDVNWRDFELEEGEQWKGFDCVRRFGGLPPEILAVRLPGHTPGHFGVAVQTDDGWLLHAGDTYYDRDELHPDRRAALLGRLARRFIHDDYARAHETLQRLADRLDDSDLRIFCSHDPEELAACREDSGPLDDSP